MSTTLQAIWWATRLFSAIIWRHGVTSQAPRVAARFIRRIECRTDRLRQGNLVIEMEVMALRESHRIRRAQNRLIEAQLEALRRRQNSREAKR